MGFAIGHRTGIIMSSGLGTYTPIPDPEPGEEDFVILTDGVTIIRKIVRNGTLCIDKVITALGFGTGGVEDTDWKNIKSSG